MCQNLETLLISKGYNVITIKKLKTVIEVEEGKNSLTDDQIMKYADKNKYIIVTKDNGLKDKCFINNIPYIDLGSPQEEVRIVDEKIKKIIAWKEYI